MPTDKVIQNPALPPPPSSDAEVLRFLRDLVTQFDVILGDRGIALNSLVDGQFNSFHSPHEVLPQVPSGGSATVTVLESVGFAYISSTAAGTSNINGCTAPEQEGRLLTFMNTGVATGNTIFIHLSGATTAGAQFLNSTGANISIANGQSITYRWASDGLFPNGVWRQVQ